MEDKLRETQIALKNAVEVLHDGHRGFADIGEQLKDSAAKEFFLAESLIRQQMAGELEDELRVLGWHDAIKEGEIGGTATGALHRTWGDLKAKLGGGDHALLETAESGEDVAKEAYQKALAREDLPRNIREILERQQLHILTVHDKVRALRDARKAA